MQRFVKYYFIIDIWLSDMIFCAALIRNKKKLPLKGQFRQRYYCNISQ